MIHTVRLKKVSPNDYTFLYELLRNRDSVEDISHKIIPNYKKHVNFLKSKPYSKWYIVLSNNKKIGSAYLTNINEIGISLEKEFDKNQIKEMLLKLLITENPKKRYLVNISPKNTKSINFFKKNGFIPIQNTYELLIDNKKNETN